MDIIHSHASSNVNDRFNYWDGIDHLYFHENLESIYNGIQNYIIILLMKH